MDPLDYNLIIDCQQGNRMRQRLGTTVRGEPCSRQKQDEAARYTQPDGGYKTTGLEELHAQLFADEGNVHPGHGEHDGDVSVTMLLLVTMLLRMIRNTMPWLSLVTTLVVMTTWTAMEAMLLC